jgi:Glycosyl hydrolase family 76
MGRFGRKRLLAVLLACVVVLVFGVQLAFAADGARARVAYAAMERRFFNPRSGDYRDTAGAPAGSHAWPFSQALAATLEVAPLERPHSHMSRVLRQRFALLDRRFGSGRLYTTWPQGYVFYDDNEWISFDLLDWNEMHAHPNAVQKAASIFAAVAAAWSTDPTLPCPGGVPWTTAPGDRSRNTVSTANAAVLGLRLYLLSPQPSLLQSSTRMLTWLDECLLAPNGLFWDNIGPDGTVDQTEWSYNQGSVMEAYRLLYLATGNPADLARAESVADTTLAAFRGRWSSEPPQFAAIFFRRLLNLAALDGRTDYVAAAQAYANQLWSQRHHSLLQQAAVVQLYAALSMAQQPPRQHARPQ